MKVARAAATARRHCLQIPGRFAVLIEGSGAEAMPTNIDIELGIIGNRTNAGALYFLSSPPMPHFRRDFKIKIYRALRH